MLLSLERALAGERARRRKATLIRPPSVPWTIASHGVDTVSYAWRDFDVDLAMQRLRVKRVDPATGELLSARRKGTASWLTDPLSGARVGVFRSPTGSFLLWCEGRLAALCSRDKEDHGLAATTQLTEGAAAAAALARRLGLAPCDEAPTLVRRLDLACDITFARQVDGSAFLQAMAHLDCPGYKRVLTHARGTSELEGVEWRTPSTYRIVHRTYDKGREAATASPGRLVRIERQHWVPSAERAEAAQLVRGDLSRMFRGPLKPWMEAAAEVVAVGPYDAYALLRERVDQPLDTRPDGRRLTLRVAERMAGTIGVLAVCGDGWYYSRRTASRRRAELRKVGIEFVADLPTGVRVNVGSVLRAASAAWAEPPSPHRVAAH